MEEESFTKKSIREEVLQELANYLHKQNEHIPKRFDFLDRPFMLMLIGGVLLTLITSLLQITANKQSLDLQYQRSRIDKKFDLVRTFPSTFENNYQIINDRLFFIIRHYKEYNKATNKQDKKMLNSYSTLIKELEKEWRKVDKLQGILLEIEVLFLSKEVKEKANNMNQKWIDFENLLHDTTVMCNKKELTIDGISKCEESRKNFKDELSNLHDNLLRTMASELNSNCYNNSCLLPQ